MGRDDDAVFKAIADPTRRALLDALKATPGLSLGELCAQHPEMTRFGVSSHLKVLEAAGLVTSVKDGRLKRHYLDAAPLQEISERWLTPLAATTAAAMLRLRDHLEKP